MLFQSVHHSDDLVIVYVVFCFVFFLPEMKWVLHSRKFPPGCQPSLLTAAIQPCLLIFSFGNLNIFIFDIPLVPEVRLHPTTQQLEPNPSRLLIFSFALPIGAISPHQNNNRPEINLGPDRVAKQQANIP